MPREPRPRSRRASQILASQAANYLDPTNSSDEPDPKDLSTSSSLSALEAAGLLTPDDISAVSASEAAIDEALEAETLEATLQATKRLEEDRNRLRDEKLALKASLDAARAQIASLETLLPQLHTISSIPHSPISEFERLRPLLARRVAPTIFGGRAETSIPATSGWGPRLEETPDTETGLPIPLQTIWIPVRIYPTFLTPREKPHIVFKSGDRIPNRIVGQTFIRDSLIFPNLIGRNGTPHPIAITGMAVLNMSHKTPSEILDYYDAADNPSLSLHDPSDTPLGSSFDPDTTPPFIPSHQTTPAFFHDDHDPRKPIRRS